MYADVVSLLTAQPAISQNRSSHILSLSLLGAAHARLRHFAKADESLGEGQRLCAELTDAACGDVSRSLGVFAAERRQLPEAREHFADSLEFARRHQDRFLEATALLNIGAMFLLEEHFDQAADWTDAAYRVSTTLGASDLTQNAMGNLGWAHYKLGDSDQALELFLEAEKRAHQLGDVVDRTAWLTNAGYVYLDSRNFPLAEQAFQKALALDQQINSKEDIYNADRVLARLYVRTNDLPKATEYARQALNVARESGSRLDELYPLLIQGQVAALRGENAEAERTFRAVEQDRHCPIFLKWEAQHRLARLYEERNDAERADREYRTALATFEAARDDVRHEDSQLSFPTNATRIYDDYIHFLVARNKPNDALRWADHSRARALAEGLGLQSKRSKRYDWGPPELNAPATARRLGGAVFFYWLGEKQSYLWAITPRASHLFSLPAGPDIETAVQRHRRTIGGPQDPLASGNEDGVALYRMLVAPAQALLPKNAKIFIIPDGSLNNLNFETLVVPEPTPHYWIEDATVANASSLRVLAASYARQQKHARNLLLIGNSVAPNDKYPQLPKAADQMQIVASHFPASLRTVLAGVQATPVAYLANQPERFAVIHFVAHGTASRLSPLDSAIVLSKSSVQDDSFKLYARDIIRHPLRAELVSISACYGAGERAYSGEGLVGLSWAFLRAGAHNVVAALWEATDVSTEQLMENFYDELAAGTPPAAALRSAKLSLLHGTRFQNPFYWAPFQFYTGSQSGVSQDASRSLEASLGRHGPN
jgi:CHAT domain-containing protein/tetratricopeptide (TPR) repeat protein